MSRFKWPVPDDKVIRMEIEEGEKATLDYRVERGKFIWEEFGPPAEMLLIGGIESWFALDELKRSFIYGNFMATVILSQIFVEHSIGGGYILAGQDNIDRKGFKAIINQSLKDGHITQELAESLHKLRRMRNPYSHCTIGCDLGTLMGRIKSEQMDPESLVVEDAKFAIRTVVDYLRHGSPNWNPDNYDWKE